MAEKLRRRAVNPLGIPIVGANPTVLNMLSWSAFVLKVKASVAAGRAWRKTPGGLLKIAF